MKKRVLSLVLCLAMVLSVLPMSVFAAGNGNADSDFVIDENGVLTAYNGDGGDVVIPEGVTSIGESAFFACTGLTKVTIPDSVTSIGHLAFAMCESLTEVIISEGVTSIGEWINIKLYPIISI